MEVWRSIGVWTMGIIGALLCCGGIDCLFDGIRDMRGGERAFDREVGWRVALTGVGLLVAGGLLLWGFYVWRR